MKYSIKKSKKHSNLSIIRFESKRGIKKIKVLTKDLIKPMFLTNLCDSVLTYFKSIKNE